MDEIDVNNHEWTCGDFFFFDWGVNNNMNIIIYKYINIYKHTLQLLFFAPTIPNNTCKPVCSRQKGHQKGDGPIQVLYRA